MPSARRLCVAWYPIYRIPDAPLAAKFLTYHRITPVPLADTHCGAVAPSANPGARPGLSMARDPNPAGVEGSGVSAPQCLPIVGLLACDLGAEQWLEPTPGPERGPGAAADAAGGSAAHGAGAENGTVAGSGAAGASSSGRGCPVEGLAGELGSAGCWRGRAALRARLAELTAAADALSYRQDLTLVGGEGFGEGSGGGGGGGPSAAAKLAAELFHSDHNYFSARAPSV